MSFLLLLIIIAAPFVEPAMGIPVKRFFLGVSLGIKELILFVLPFVIFMLLFNACVQFAQNAPRIILRVLLAIVLSNVFATSLGSCLGLLTYHFPMTFIAPSTVSELVPLFSPKIYHLIPNSWAMFSGIISGIWFPRRFPDFSLRMDLFFAICVRKILNVVLFVLPAFIFGFMLKICHEGSALIILKNYIPILAFVLFVSLSYIFFLYLWASDFRWNIFGKFLRNMLPATSCAFCSMSSAATMPITIDCVEHNGKNKVFVRSIVPMSVNVHLIGNNFTISFLAFAILASHGAAIPSPLAILSFIVCALVAKFSVVAVPGGSILVMLPILERYLHFDGEMSSIIFAINMLACPFITAINVLGNGAFALVAEKFCPPVKGKTA
jgi:Na+/H+-dicarboxylate symporter